jgi:hypothetical protein
MDDSEYDYDFRKVLSREKDAIERDIQQIHSILKRIEKAASSYKHRQDLKKMKEAA